MQEWLNWPAWKASKPQKGFGGSNPPLSAKRNGARRCRAIGIFCFIPAPLKLVCTGWRGETKMVDLSTSCEVKFCKEPHGECGERRVAHRAAKSIPLFPQKKPSKCPAFQSLYSTTLLALLYRVASQINAQLLEDLLIHLAQHNRRVHLTPSQLAELRQSLTAILIVITQQ